MLKLQNFVTSCIIMLTTCNAFTSALGPYLHIYGIGFEEADGRTYYSVCGSYPGATVRSNGLLNFTNGCIPKVATVDDGGIIYPIYMYNDTCILQALIPQCCGTAMIDCYNTINRMNNILSYSTITGGMTLGEPIISQTGNAYCDTVDNQLKNVPLSPFQTGTCGGYILYLNEDSSGNCDPCNPTTTTLMTIFTTTTVTSMNITATVTTTTQTATVTTTAAPVDNLNTKYTYKPVCKTISVAGVKYVTCPVQLVAESF
jgi:hypothetical protein